MDNDHHLALSCYQSAYMRSTSIMMFHNQHFVRPYPHFSQRSERCGGPPPPPDASICVSYVPATSFKYLKNQSLVSVSQSLIIKIQNKLIANHQVDRFHTFALVLQATKFEEK